MRQKQKKSKRESLVEKHKAEKKVPEKKELQAQINKLTASLDGVYRRINDLKPEDLGTGYRSPGGAVQAAKIGQKRQTRRTPRKL